jgi:hypothetical protein
MAQGGVQGETERKIEGDRSYRCGEVKRRQGLQKWGGYEEKEVTDVGR